MAFYYAISNKEDVIMQAKLIIFGFILTVGSLIPLYKPIGVDKISHKHLSVFASSAGIIFTSIPYSFIAKHIDLVPMPWTYYIYLVITMCCYLALTSFIKIRYLKKYHDLS